MEVWGNTGEGTTAIDFELSVGSLPVSQSCQRMSFALKN